MNGIEPVERELVAARGQDTPQLRHQLEHKRAEVARGQKIVEEQSFVPRRQARDHALGLLVEL